MNPKTKRPLNPRLFLTAMFVGTMTFSISTLAQPAPVEPDAQKTITVLPLEQSASRGITTRDPSSVVKCKNEYWVFYTGRGVPSYHSKDLANWERGPAVFKTAPEWIAKTVPENRHMSYWAPDVIKLGDQYL
ncbi:MAG TPA: family 43 glycosylhydrolase, partial [Verrucomicrobiae bacterium]|nr:family 43 glycosylhydrolase [Verrucomicrobiae bacterium]